MSGSGWRWRGWEATTQVGVVEVGMPTAGVVGVVPVVRMLVRPIQMVVVLLLP